MEINESISLQVSDASHISEIRRYSHIYADGAGFNEVQSGKLAIIASEAATNILKHAQEGEIIFHLIENNKILGVEMLAVDKGQGMYDAEMCMQDGYTTAGTQGTGLGAIARQSDEFDIYSLPEKGTVISSKLWASKNTMENNIFQCEGISIPLKGFDVCGDLWCSRVENNIHYLMVCDGLGHGVPAAEASSMARHVFLNRHISSLTMLMQDVHLGLKSSRGAAIAIAAINPANDTIEYIGVGNIAGVIIDEDNTKHMVSLNGTMGHAVRKFQSFTYPLPSDATLIMHSDGLNTRWSLKDYPGIINKSESVISSVLYRDFTRGRDDVTVVTARRVAK